MPRAAASEMRELLVCLNSTTVNAWPLGTVAEVRRTFCGGGWRCQVGGMSRIHLRERVARAAPRSDGSILAPMPLSIQHRHAVVVWLPHLMPALSPRCV